MTKAPRWIVAIAGLAIVAAIVLIGLAIVDKRSWPDIAQGPGDAPPTAAQVAHGQYLAKAADCVACHTAPDGQPFAGGYALKTPFGTLVSSNITSDRATGIGGWTAQQFDAALRKGVGPKGHLYPAMPYTAYTRMSDADVADLWAYVRTIAPVSHAVQENQLPLPFGFRPFAMLWDGLFFRQARFQPDPHASDMVNRGAYLSDALGHCGSCHTPKNLLGSDKAGHALQGGTLQGWHAPDLTNNARTGLGGWSAADIAAYLKTGSNRFTAASGPMSEAIVNSTQHLSDQDLAALAAYFKALPARNVPASPALAMDDPRMMNGRRVFEANCGACHVSSGKGVAGMIPAFAGNPAIAATDPSSLLNVVLNGTGGTATAANPTGAAMPRFDWKLSDRQIADVLTYARNGWGNRASAIGAADVARARKAAAAQPSLDMLR